jgi:hypothetical protein
MARKGVGVAALVMVKPGFDWQSSGGLFDWTLEFLIARLSDREASGWLQTIVAEKLDLIWIPDLPQATQQEIFELLQTDLLASAERELPESADKPFALARLQDLVDLTYPDPGR